MALISGLAWLGGRADGAELEAARSLAIAPALPDEYLQVLESARSAIMVVDTGGLCAYVNRRAVADFGLDRSMIGLPISDIRLLAEDPDFPEAYQRSVGSREAVVYESFHEVRGAWFEVQVAPFGPGTYVSWQNVNERRLAADRLRRSEERYRLAARATSDVIWDWDLGTDRIEWNENLTACFGYPADELSGRGDWWKARIHPDDRARIEATVRDVVEGGGEQFVAEYRFRRADGSYADVYDRGYVVRDDQLRARRMVGAMQDLTDARRATRALADREQLMATIFGQAMVGILHRDLRSGELVVNDRFCQIVGRTAEELRRRDHNDYTHPEDATWNRPLFETRMVTGEPFQIEKRYVRPDGGVVWCNVHVSFLRDDTGEVAACIVVAEDITSRKAAELELVRSRTLLQTVIDSVDDLIFVKDRHGTFVLTNRAVNEGFAELTDRRTADFFDPEVADAFDAADQEVIETGKANIVEEVIPINGHPRTFQTIKVPWLKDGGVAGIVGVSRDITERIAAEENLRWTATHDALTGLPNRRLLQESLATAIDEAATEGAMVAVLQVDLDHFKHINDTLGHDAGDALLIHVAERLRRTVAVKDAVARTGGDEFAIVLKVDSPEVAEALAARIIAQLREPQRHDGHLLDCRGSIGISLYPMHGRSAQQLLKSADVALYRAKALGRGRALMFDAEMRGDIQRRASMISAVQDALAADRIFPFYQPKVDLRTGRVAGFEALLRWRDAGGRLREPAQIAAAFDDPHLAGALGDRIVAQVTADMRRWLDAGIEFGHVAVNAAAADFLRGDYGEHLLEQLARARIAPQHFQLEVTETVLLGHDGQYVERALKLLSSEGVHIALDDFGTGYASLRHLRDFPVDSIKLDRSFVRDMEHDSDDAAIVLAMLNLGRSIGIDVVAEGVETHAQMAHLLNIGCPYGQGYLFARAAPADEVAALVRELPARLRAG